MGGRVTGIALDLRDNINLWGAPPAATRALRSARASRFAAYPSTGARPLAALLSARSGVQVDEVVVGCGSDDLIDAAFRALSAPGSAIAWCEPTFSMVPVFARTNARRPRPVASLPSGAADVDALLATGAELIYLCSPNNPTGIVTPVSEIRRLIARAPGVVLLDEAYAEFAEETGLRAAAPALGNLVVTRTLSKAWGLAGLRVGYAIGARRHLAALSAALGPYKVNALAESAALAALTHDTAWQRRTTMAAISARDRLEVLLAARSGLRVWPSRGNFLFVELESCAREVAERFLTHGIAVRAFSGLPGFGEAIRLGVAPWSRLRRVPEVAERLWP
jgi:histidinol-phosphate aminotransferase